MKSNICEQHNLPYINYCASESCKKYLCEICTANHNGSEHIRTSKEQIFQKIQEKVRNNLAHLQNIQDEWNKLENQTKEIDENQKTTLENNRAIAKNMLFQIEQILMESCVGRNSELLLSFIAREKENLEQQKKHNEEINKRIQDMPFLEMFELDEKLEEAKAKPPSDTFVAIQLDNSRVLHSQALGNKIAQELKGALNAALNETPKNEKDLSTQAQSSIINSIFKY
jgi:hypothetical protein